MFTYEIRRNKTSPQRTSTQGNHVADIKDRQRLFNKHFIRFWGDVGSIVAFKRPKRVKQTWVVKYIECDLDKIKWTNDGWTPNYIQLEGVVRGKDGKETIVQCWTCESQLKPVGEERGKTRKGR